MRKFLLLPSIPTPNGPLHLGHISGPYLKMDVARRIAQRAGHRAFLIGGFDVFDTYMEVCAERTGITPVALCLRNIPSILTDLHSLDIEFDSYVNLLEEKEQVLYEHFIRTLLGQLCASSLIAAEEEYLTCNENGHPLVGARLSGRCPCCGAQASGFSCEECGQHLRPSDLMDNNRTAFGRWHPTLWFRAPGLKAVLESDGRTRLAKEFRDIVDRYILRCGVELRVTVPSGWGPATSSIADGNKVYSGFASLASMLVADKHYQALSGDSSAFLPNSEVEIICSFGVDNLITRFISGVAVPLTLGSIRPPDRFWINRFCMLDGKKFSTSAGNAIWVADLPFQVHGISDTVRFYLASTAPGIANSEFKRVELGRVSSEFFSGDLNLVQKGLAGLSGRLPKECSSGLRSRVHATLDAQNRTLSSQNFSLPSLAAQIRSWTRFALDMAGTTDAYWAAKSLALVAYPITPRFATELWSALGATGLPNEANFLTITQPLSDVLQPFQELAI